ncbi:ferredoxin [Amycolatopsis arida]|uniref:Ferredoxin n=1 Tax=Amycolatopsis arida TaxID=587909 RepID=A0A1I5XLF8_9PSEU|nr:ferredoxin [Amycolatopsis arida]TDX97373.1 ferredoxin [Amycolatopsis arida]SFQ32813.1 ferredoxin [Amycolatopsis arida]
MEVSVDRTLCEANEVCIGIAPAVFELDDDEELRVVQPNPPHGEVERVMRAVASCPRNALVIKE